MDDEHEGMINPLAQDDEGRDDSGQDEGELDITREETDFTELANARAKEAMDQLESMRSANREARRRRKEAWEKEHQGTIHLSDEMDLSPEMLQKAEQQFDEFGQPINNPAGFDQFGQPVDGQMPMQPIGGVVDPMQPMSNGQMGQPMNYGPMPNGPTNGAPMNAAMPNQPMQPMNGTMPGDQQMVGQMGVVTNLDGTVPIASLDPTSRPMKQVPTVVVQKPKKVRKGWLIAVSVSAFIAIALAVLAVLIVITTKPDTVVKAIENITTSGLAENIAVNGEIDFEFKDDSMAMSSLAVNLEGVIRTTNLENSLNAKLVADMASGDKLGVEANEVYAKNGGVYVKLDKAGALIKEMQKGAKNVDATENEDATEATDEDSTETAAEKAKRETEEAIALITKIITKTDGKWVRINSDEADTTKLGDAKGGTCEAALANNLAANQATIATIYRTYPFVSSTTKGVELEQVENTVYKINLDLNNLTSFFNGIESLKSLAAYEECKGLVQPAIVGSDVAEIFANVKNLCAEVSEDYIITRVYFEYSADWGEMTADLYLDYPETVRIEVPEDHVDLSQTIKAVSK